MKAFILGFGVLLAVSVFAQSPQTRIDLGPDQKVQFGFNISKEKPGTVELKGHLDWRDIGMPQLSWKVSGPKDGAVLAFDNLNKQVADQMAQLLNALSVVAQAGVNIPSASLVGVNGISTPILEKVHIYQPGVYVIELSGTVGKTIKTGSVKVEVQPR